METKITAATIARTAVLGLALANQVLSATGHSVLPIENEQVELIVSTGFTVLTSLVAWWKNNSFTKAAQIGDAAMQEAKED